jgi:Ser/Thr protein kinase RdoA (MazF antagonist)
LKDFYELTVRGRARRLRKAALAALEHYDLDVKHVRLVTNEMNGIFRVDVVGGDKYILRVCRADGLAHSLEEIRSEMMWLHALGRDTNLLIPAPLETRDGSLVTTVTVPGVPEPRHCVIFSWVPGRNISEQLTEENIERWGTFAARLHDHGAAFVPPDGFSIASYDRIFPFDEPVTLFDEENCDLLPPSRREVFEAAIARVQAAIDRLKASGEPMRVLHGDLHQWNVKVYRGRIGAFDFEDLMWGWPIQDIATTLYYFHGHDSYEGVVEAFKRGYTRHREWPERATGELTAFLVCRALVLANGLLVDLDPEWQEATPRFFERTEARLRALLEDIKFNIGNYPLFE